MASNGRNIVDGDLSVRGTLTMGAIKLPDGSVGDAEFDPTDPLSAVNQQHQFNRMYVQGKSTDTVISETRPIHLAFGAGTAIVIRAGVVDACVGNATITIDLKKNGASILSSTILIDSTMADYDSTEGTVDSAEEDYVTSDVFELVITVAAGTGTLGKGLFVVVVFREDSE